MTAKHDWSSVSRATAERLMATASDYWGDTKPTEGWVKASKDFHAAVETVRAESAPPLRTRAKVDRDIASAARAWCRDHDPGECGFLVRINTLCAEPLAPEPEAKQPGLKVTRRMADPIVIEDDTEPDREPEAAPLCPECERPMARYRRGTESGRTCIGCNAAGDSEFDHPDAAEPEKTYPRAALSGDVTMGMNSEPRPRAMTQELREKAAKFDRLATMARELQELLR